MSRLRVNCFGVSLDGFGAGPDQSLENPMGAGGMALHNWAFGTRTFRTMFGQEGGSTGIDERFAAFCADALVGRTPAEVSRTTDLGDSILTAIVVAPFLSRPVRFVGLDRLRVQECDRVAALHEGLTACGARVEMRFIRKEQRLRVHAGEAGLDRGDLPAGRLRVGRVELQLDQPADMRTPNRREAEVAEAALHRLALRVEDAGLRPDEHRGLHARAFT